MNSQDQVSFDPRIADWLESDPNKAPDQALEVVLAAFPSVDQRRGSRLPRRISTMPTTLKYAFGAVAVIAVVLGGALLLRPGTAPGSVGGPPPSPTPTPMPFPTTSEGLPVAPGTYALDLQAQTVTGVAAPVRVMFTVPSGWQKNITPTTLWHSTKSQRFGFFTVDNVTVDPCPSTGTDSLNPPIGPTVDDLVGNLPRHTDLTFSAPTDVTVAGFSGKQLEVTAPTVLPCPDPYEPVWTAPQGAPFEDGGHAMAAREKGRMVVLDVDGVRLAIASVYQADASADDLAELQAILDSVRIDRLPTPPAVPSPSPS